MTTTTHIALWALTAILTVSACAPDRPGDPDFSPLYRSNQEDGQPSSGERGNMMITELNYAGSVTDDGVHHADDIFIELQNKHPRPINISGWHIFVEGSVEDSFRVPTVDKPIQPNDFFVIARDEDGAFKDVADVFIEDLRLVTEQVNNAAPRVFVELRDHDRRLMESAGTTEEEVFAGGFDTVSVRSMERVQLIFSNRGGNSRNWHAYSDNTGLDTIAEGWRTYTLASPGGANSADYSGSSSSGNFE
jgi:hypothetical protein